ncbi:MAG: biotin/lipoyl-binding protein [Firmicutes bacterium]|nr:biotin/lipoyl-binding protein [Bacillota bacterium]
MKKSSKNKVLAIIAGVVILALLGVSVVYAATSNRKRPELAPDAITKVDRGDLTSVYTASATVASGRQGTFQILDGTKVVSVLVRVGDTVKEGDLLATFDADGLDQTLRVKKMEYEAAQRTYQEYLSSATDAPAQATSIKARIAELEAKVAAQQAGDSGAAQAPQNTQLDSIKSSIAKLLGNTKIANRIVDTVFAESGTVAKTVSFFQNLLGGGLFGGLLGGSSFDLSSMMGAGMGDSLELMQLKLQDSMSGITGGISMDSLYKSLADSAENAYMQTKEAVALLKEGWTAQHDGIIREVNIVEGEVYREAQQGQNPATSNINVAGMLSGLMGGGGMDLGSLLGGLFSNQASGMVVEYYPFTASFLLGKYDIAKVALDQRVKVTSVSGKDFEAFVSFISPVARESGDINISSLMGAGGSARGVEARITIPQPDKSITIGLDVDVTIELETKSGVLRIPVESVAIDDETNGYYVYVLERVSRTVKKQPVTMGLFDGNSYYEVLGGLSEGTEIVRAPIRSMKDGQKVKLV